MSVCSVREGSKGCPWWVSGCLNPAVKPEVKMQCEKSIERLTREPIKVK